jgi:hypothetical protein
MAVSSRNALTVGGYIVWLLGLSLALDLVVLAWLAGSFTIIVVVLAAAAAASSAFGVRTFWRASNGLEGRHLLAWVLIALAAIMAVVGAAVLLRIIADLT